MTGKRRLIAAGLLLAAALAAPALAPAPSQEPSGATTLTPVAAGDGVPEGSPIAARPAKERMAVYVLLAWVWLLIAVLFVLVRLRAREADRTFRLGLDRAVERSPRNPGD